MINRDESPVSIVRFSPALAGDFYRLNAEWLQLYFALEPIDEEVLGDPVKHILGPGGDILFARRQNEIVGTCALMPDDTGIGHFELTKMGVTSGAQGRGIGRRLIEAVLVRYAELHGRFLFLETNSRLIPAIRLYESVGFRHALHPKGVSDYQRGMCIWYSIRGRLNRDLNSAKVGEPRFHGQRRLCGYDRSNGF